jgi:hypothetical protein
MSLLNINRARNGFSDLELGMYMLGVTSEACLQLCVCATGDHQTSSGIAGSCEAHSVQYSTT